MKARTTEEPYKLGNKVEYRDPLHIHKNERYINDPPCILLFVHGFNGDRLQTWGRFPQFIQEDLLSVDVGLYSYKTAGSRFFSTTPDVPKQANTLAHRIRDLGSQYSRILLIGHSMGGVLLMGSIAYLQTREPKALESVKSLFLMATPQLGSTSAYFLFWPFSKDARALYPLNDYLHRIREVFTNDINHYLDRKVFKDGAEITHIPVFAVSGDRDRWVSEMSTEVSIPTSQKDQVAGTHTSIVKPDHNGSDGYSFVKKSILMLYPEYLPKEFETTKPDAKSA